MHIIISKYFKTISLYLTILFLFIFPQALAFQQSNDKPKNGQTTSQEKLHFNLDDKIKSDPAVINGTLANGLRYGIVKANEPKKTAYIYLQIKMGSLYENEQQLGFAHFLEHMAFNGSKNIPEGELNKLLSNHGLSFGAHSNAFTSYEQTTYIFKIASLNEEALNAVFFALDEISDNLTIEEKAVEKERGVVLSELNVRKSPNQKNYEKSIKFMFNGTLLPKRLPIGKVETLNKANAQGLRSLYKAYYRPNNAYLAISGDFNVKDIKNKIEKTFSKWQKSKNKIKQPDLGSISFIKNSKRDKPALAQIETFFDKGVTPVFSFSHIKSFQQDKNNYDTLLKNSISGVAYAIFNNRIAKLTNLENSILSGGGAVSTDIQDTGEYSTVFAAFTEENSKEAIKLILHEWKKMLRDGVVQGEIDEVIKGVKLSLSESIKSYPTRKGSTWVSLLNTAETNKGVITHPQDQSNFFYSTIAQYTPENIIKSFRKDWSGGQDMFYFTATKEGVLSKKEILKLATDEFKKDFAKKNSFKKVVFAYDYPQAKYKIKSKIYDKKNNITHVVLNNNISITVKPSQYKKNDIDIALYLDGGSVSLKQNQAVYTALLSFFTSGGLKKHDINDLDKITKGKKVGFGFSKGSESFRFISTTNKQDFKFQLQLWKAFIKDAAYRKNADTAYQQLIDRIYDTLDKHPNQVVNLKGDEVIYGGDKRFYLASKDDLKSVSMADIKKFLTPVFKKRAIKFKIVGDVDPDFAIDMIGQVFGNLNKRPKDFNEWKKGKKLNYGKAGTYVFPHKGEDDQATLSINWKTKDYSDYVRAIYEEVLINIMRERLTDTIREKLSLTYSPNIGNFNSPTYDDFGFVSIQLSIKPDDKDKVEKAINAIISDIIKNSVSDDEIKRAQKRILAIYESSKQTNSYWRSIIYDYPNDKDELDIHYNYEKYIKSVSKERLKQIAVNIFTDDTKIIILSTKEK